MPIGQDPQPGEPLQAGQAVIRLWSRPKRATTNECRRQPAVEATVTRFLVLCCSAEFAGIRAAKKHHIARWRSVATSHASGFPAVPVVSTSDPLDATSSKRAAPDRVEALSRTCSTAPLWSRRAEDSHARSWTPRRCRRSQCAPRVQSLIAHARRQMDQVERRLLKGETIAHDEKVRFRFSRNTPRWRLEGQGWSPCGASSEFRYALVEDQFQFIRTPQDSVGRERYRYCGVESIHELAGNASRLVRGVQLRSCQQVPQPSPATGWSARRNARPRMRCRARVGFRSADRELSRKRRTFADRVSAPAPGGRVAQSTTSSIAVSTGACSSHESVPDEVCRTSRCIVDH